MNESNHPPLLLSLRPLEASRFGWGSRATIYVEPHFTSAEQICGATRWRIAASPQILANPPALTFVFFVYSCPVTGVGRPVSPCALCASC